MKICFVGPADSAHIVKWCNWFVSKGHDVSVISFTKNKIKGAHVFYINANVSPVSRDIDKIKYLFKGKTIKKIIDKIEPDIVNVHYATSYGAATALGGMENYILSVWGSDIYDFPKKSPLHKALLKYSLKKAKYLFSTSQAMADEASKYTDKKFEITPFGVDMDLFNPNKRTRNKDAKPFVFGTVKTLSDLYGIKYILEAAAILREKHPDLDIAVRIAGDGKQSDEYKELVNQLGIQEITTFLGRITQEQAATEWANMDVAVIPSILYESFGVAAVEAQASSTPIIISDVAGLLETTVPNISSDVVPTEDAKAIADSLFKLYSDTALRREMGIAGRNNVVSRYELHKCFSDIEQKYTTLLKSGGKRKLSQAINITFYLSISIKEKAEFIVGTVKGLSDKYGIAHLLKAVAKISSTTDIPIKLRIAGKGNQEQEYHQLAKELGIDDITTWLGFISQERAAEEWANMDIAIVPSTLDSESFGVSAVEAQACGTAVIISDVPGLMEATKPNFTSLVVKRKDEEEIAKAIIKLYSDKKVRENYGMNARSFVMDNYELNNCFINIENLYKSYKDRF